MKLGKPCIGYAAMRKMTKAESLYCSSGRYYVSVGQAGCVTLWERCKTGGYDRIWNDSKIVDGLKQFWDRG